MEKQCAKCGRWLPATEEWFHRGQRYKGGLRSWCKDCYREQGRQCYAANREARQEYSRQYNAANRDAIAEHRRQYHAANREAIRERQRQYYAASREVRHQYYAANREAIREYHRQYHAANREIILEQRRQYIQAHPEQNRTYAHRRRARKLQASGNHTAADVKRQYKAQRGRCYYCGAKVGNVYQVDHVIPLSRGGSNGPENIVITCPPCNRSKGDKLPHEWRGTDKLL